MIPRCKFLHNLSCEQVSNRIIELEDENARLRSCLSDDKENARLVFGEYHLLVEENAKLRELVCDMWDVALHPQLFGDGSYLLRRMCDLGIDAER